MIYSITYSNLAKNDLVGIKKYIKYVLLNEYSANRIIKDIQNHINDLRLFPKKYVICMQLEDKEIRRITIGKYNVYYFIDDNELIINILRIVYGGVDISQVALD